jgi:hypothetical protein
MKYRALTTLTHTPTGALLPAGAWVDLSHLTPDERLLLLDVGAVEAVTDEDNPAPVAAQEEE